MSHTEDYQMPNGCKGTGLCSDPYCSDHGKLNPKSPNHAPPRKAGDK